MRVLFMRALTRVWLDLEVPVLSEPQVTSTLNDSGDITLELPVDYLSRKGEDGRRVLSEWETLVVYQEDRGPVHVGLIDNVVLTGESLTVSAGGLSMQSNGAPWNTASRGLISADPAVVFRDIWAMIGSADNALSLWITGDTSSPGRVGKPEGENHRFWRLATEETTAEVESLETKMKALEQAVETTTKALFAACGLKKIGKVKVQTEGGSATANDTIWIDSDNRNIAHVLKWFPARNIKDAKGRTRFKAAGDEWVAVPGVQSQSNAYLAAVRSRDETKDILRDRKGRLSTRRSRMNDFKEGEAEPYELSWHSSHDMSSTIDDMVEAGPFDWCEWAELSPSGELSYGLKVGAPRLGRRLSGPDDPRFVLGVNVYAHPEVGVTDPYTDVKAYGAGSGSKTLHEYRIWQDDYRVRRIKMISDKDAKTRDRLKRVADTAAEQIKSQQFVSINSLVVIDHDYARYGSYGLGDEVLFEGILADGSEVALWLRVMEMTRTEGRTDLRVETM